MNPKYGRFTSSDPVSFRGGNNLYNFANNNPLRWLDPWGLEPYWPFGRISPEKFEEQTGLSPNSPEGALAYTLFVENAIQDPGEILGRYNQLLALLVAAGGIESQGLERFSVLLENQAPGGVGCKVRQALESAKKNTKMPSGPSVRTSELVPTHGKTMSNSQFNALKQNIAKDGIREPIKYVEVNGQKYVVDGHHRLQAAQELGIRDVPAEPVQLPYQGYKSVEDLFSGDRGW